MLTSETVVTRLPRVCPRLATADDTAVAAELPVLDAALLAALVPASPCSIGPAADSSSFVFFSPGLLCLLGRNGWLYHPLLEHALSMHALHASMF